MEADEVVQVYIHYPQQEGMPVKELKSFSRISLKPNKEGVANFSIPVSELKKWDNDGWKLFSGEYKLVVGSNSADEKLVAVIKL